MGFYNTYITVKLTVSRNLLDDKWMLDKPTVCNSLTAPDFQIFYFCEFLDMRI